MPTNFDKTSNVFAETKHYVCDEGKCVKNRNAGDLAFWWLKPGTQLLCSDDTAQLGDIAIATYKFVAHMRPMDTGFGSIAQCIRPYDFSCVPRLERTRRLYVALMYKYARDLAKLGLPPKLRLSPPPLPFSSMCTRGSVELLAVGICSVSAAR